MQDLPHVIPGSVCRLFFHGCHPFTLKPILCLQHDHSCLHGQFEVVSQFFVGMFDSSETYIDNIYVVAFVNLTSVTGFWFDCVTSIPWSYFDLSAYRVCSPFFFNLKAFTFDAPHTWQFFHQACQQDRKPAFNVQSNQRILRFFKVLRILKMIRLLKGVKVVE